MSNFQKNIELGKSQRMKKNELRAKYVRNMSGKSHTQAYKKTMGFVHKEPSLKEVLTDGYIQPYPFQRTISKALGTEGKLDADLKRGMSARVLKGGKKKLVKGT
jgi:hypothetical protein